MLDNLILVSGQVFILFILIAIGFVCGKTGLIGERGAKTLTDVVLYIATPCIMIKSFQDVKYDPALAVNLAITTVCAVLTMVASIFISRLVFRDKDMSRRKVLSFSVVFSNCAFMSLPLQNAVLGAKGVFYGSVYVAVFNIIVWSYGIADMSGDGKGLNIRKILLNPGVIGVTIAVVLFFLRLSLPELLMQPINYLAALNTPLPMLVIGYYLSRTAFKKYLRDGGIYLVMLLRLVLIPCVSMVVMRLCGVSGDILTACTIASSAPVAATTTMFATKFGRDIELSVGTVSFTTVVSIVTMPLIIAISQTIG